MYSDLTGLEHRVDRWRLTGTIRALSAIHAGDGGEASLKERCGKEASGTYATVFRNETGVPILPGSSVKGALRAWAEAHGIADAITGAIFGNLEEGSGITIHDAFLSKRAQPKEDERKYSHWSAERGTALTQHVVIEERTGTAAESLLYQTEFVPEGSEFTLQITGQGVSAETRGALLYLLEHAFTSSGRPARLGGAAANGWGEVRWQAGKIEELKLAEWLNGPPRHWTEALTELTGPARSQWLAPKELSPAGAPGHTVVLGLRLHFEGLMLVNDPTREQKGDSKGQGGVGRAVVRRLDGRPYLPASSIRGALRARARRIWQTLAWGGSQDLAQKGQILSAPDTGSEKLLASFLKMFGATGWRSPFEIADFDLDGAERKYVKEFVAIDRFTGSVSGDRKYNAHALLKPIFQGTVRIRADRWASAKAGDWTWLLLLWTLRDWVEGDGVIGSGSAKGWGRFRAEIDVESTGEPSDFLRRVLNRDQAALADKRLDEWEKSLLADIRKGAA